jgi:hypothetical protein
MRRFALILVALCGAYAQTTAVITTAPVSPPPPPPPGSMIQGVGAAVNGAWTFTTPNGQIVSPQQGQQQQPARFDCAADGAVVNAITGEPIARAKVSVLAAGTSSSTTADNSGRWTLSNVACGPVQVQATRVGFLQNGFGQRNARVPFRPMVFAPGSPVHDVKIELTPQAVVMGRVVDDQGDPVMNVQVSTLALRIVDGRESLQPNGGTSTNDLGEYRLHDLLPGKYVVCASPNRGGQGTYRSAPQAPPQTVLAESCYPGPPEGGSSATVDAPAGRETKIDFALSQTLAVRVRGTVSGVPAGRGFGLSLIRRGMNPGFGNFPAPVRPDGTFEVSGVIPGSYILNANYNDGKQMLRAHVPIEVGSSDIDGVAVQLQSGFSVTGTVRVESQSGAGPRQFGINLRPVEQGQMNGPGQVKWADDHLSFTIENVMPGTFRLDVFPPPPFYIKSANLAGQDVLRNEIPISQAAGPIEIVLRDDGGSVEGDVVDGSGQPMSSGIMLLGKTGRPLMGQSQLNGHFKLQNLAPGDYTLYAWDNPQEVAWADADWMRRYAGAGMAVSVAAGQNAQAKITQQRVPQQ